MGLLLKKRQTETEREYELVYAGKERKEDILADTLSVSFQPIKKFGEVKENEWHNMLIFGENLQALKHLLKLKEQGKLRNPDGTSGVKLVYIDPPFATKKEFKDSKGKKAYQDKIAGAEFLEFLRKRLIFLRELLTDDGSIYVHLDWKMGHYIKILLDEIFDKNNFRNEIVWHYFMGGKPEDFYSRKHDVIFFYTKSDNYKFKIFTHKRILPYKPSLGSHKDLEQIKCESCGKNSGVYLSTVKGDDVWDLSGVFNMSNEYTGFPTQKPEKLLERIIKASSNEGDIVLDCFAGSGTTGAVAEKLGRKWIMIDSSKLAIHTIQKRMLNLKTEISNKGKPLKPKPFVLYNTDSKRKYQKRGNYILLGFLCFIIKFLSIISHIFFHIFSFNIPSVI